MTALAWTVLGAIFAAWFYRIERNLVGINEELSAINASLTEASAEIVGKIAQLEAAAAAGQLVDSALLAEVRERAAGLANVVPNAFVVDEGAAGGDAVAEGASGDPATEG